MRMMAGDVRCSGDERPYQFMNSTCQPKYTSDVQKLC